MTQEKPSSLEKTDREKLLPPVWRGLKERLLEAVPSRNEGLDIERAKKFLSGSGLPAKDFLIFFREDFPRIEAMLRDAGFAGRIANFQRSGLWALFIPELDLVVLERNPEREKTTAQFLPKESWFTSWPMPLRVTMAWFTSSTTRKTF